MPIWNPPVVEWTLNSNFKLYSLVLVLVIPLIINTITMVILLKVIIILLYTNGDKYYDSYDVVLFTEIPTFYVIWGRVEM